MLAGSGAGAATLGAGRIHEDPRLREVEHGYEPVAPQAELRKKHGWFNYRFKGGESPADCHARTSAFLASMMRPVERKRSERVLIVTHGLTIRYFVMRFLHLSVEQLDELATPPNCAIVTTGKQATLGDCLFTSGTWVVLGLQTRTSGAG